MVAPSARPFPLGVVGHWPAGNVEIQPILSMTCALLGGNAALVRIPSGLVDVTQRLMGKLAAKRSGRTADCGAFLWRPSSMAGRICRKQWRNPWMAR